MLNKVGKSRWRIIGCGIKHASNHNRENAELEGTKLNVLHTRQRGAMSLKQHVQWAFPEWTLNIGQKVGSFTNKAKFGVQVTGSQSDL